MVANLESSGHILRGREVTVIGIISNKITTKNGNIMVVIEDETGEAKIMFMNGTSRQGKGALRKGKASCE